MGFSTVRIPVKQAIAVSRGWPVVSASKQHYFRHFRADRADIREAERVENEDRIFFRLVNGDFVEVEQTQEDRP